MKKYIFGATILLVAALNQAVQAQSPDQDNSMMAAVNQQDDVSEALASTKTHQEQPEPNRACYDADNDVDSDSQLAMTDSSFLEALSKGYVGIDDLKYIGPIDSIDNVRFYRSPRDGSCSGDSFMNGSALVYATDEQEAELKCSSLIQNPHIESAGRYYIRTKFDHQPMTSNEDVGMLNDESADTIYLHGFWLCSKQMNSD